LARPDFRAAAARRLSEERELSPAIVSLLSSDAPSRPGGIRNLPLDRIVPNPEQPRVTFIQETIDELAASIREHGVLQPVLVRPLGPGQFQLVAGERRWRASQVAGLTTIPAMIEEIDDETALEIAIIENLQREDLSPLDEATMYDKMIREHGYSIRKLAEKLGKDKGYLENRLRLADAPPEVRELVSLRKDTLSHAYELLKIADPKKRRRLAEQVARGELSLVKLRERVEGRRTRVVVDVVAEVAAVAEEAEGRDVVVDANVAWTGARSGAPLTDESLVTAKRQLSDSIEELIGVLQSPDVLDTIGATDRSNLAKYLTIAKLRLENVIAMVRSGETRE
jgi:ParB family transcriptional regulator, chromosome partitioning protein